MSLTKEQTASLIISYLSYLTNNNVLDEDKKESLRVAITCIGESFSLDGDILPTSLKERTLKTILQENLNTLEATQKIHNEEAEALKKEGNEAMIEGQYEEAIKKYTEAIQFSKNVAYYSNRSLAYSKLGRYEDAVNDATLAINIDPSFSKAYSRLGYAKCCQDKLEDGMTAYKRAIDLEGTNASKTLYDDYEDARFKYEQLKKNDDSEERKSIKEVTSEECPEKNNNQDEGFTAVNHYAQNNDNKSKEETKEENRSQAADLSNIARLLGSGVGGLMNNPQLKQMVFQAINDNPDASRQVKDVLNNPLLRTTLSELMNTKMGGKTPQEMLQSGTVNNLIQSFLAGTQQGKK
ncbi:uncharacterized protein NDAI_0I02240 [Naumovozyma dairenensis CBS 421]|uniref:SGTA homodimerisation domain-containing protein n=1 Tax=Naumovozyma dairenensis (strain ATCC 10597 / BCRC 20456 / CBS 421 / NBRC 0211 / NRRL Y-12639) TaxID=1071378 RepID=G0WG82_NAUDC|nr:hypothetical protein NDAI_0I02240 [Naumovozyma dairenensis CBS 421]CCD26793.1 hypothetical protein NDAI_0I02240 [Naumovozyma dairenensis CBS 421]